jgi:hypothetical protein
MMNRKNKMSKSRLRQWKLIAVGCMLLVFGLPETVLSERVKGCNFYLMYFFISYGRYFSNHR